MKRTHPLRAALRVIVPAAVHAYKRQVRVNELTKEFGLPLNLELPILTGSTTSTSANVIQLKRAN